MNPSISDQLLAQFPDIAEALQRLEVTPGSTEAKAKGCVCPPLVLSDSRETSFHFVNQTCPLHRTE